MLLFLLAGAALTWVVDKYGPDENAFIDNKGDKIKIKDPYNPIELGYARQLGKNYQWSTEKSRHLGEWSYKNPMPYINVQGGGENTRVSDMRQVVLPDQKKRFAAIVHKKENIEEYWRFDNWLGGVFPDAAPPRQSAIAYRYE